MARVDGSLGSLVQGVSQQPSRARLPGQSEEQINVTNDEVFGLSRRNGTVTRSTVAGFSADTNGRTTVEHGDVSLKGNTLEYVMRVGADPALKLIDGTTVHDVHIDTAAKAYLANDDTKRPYQNSILLRELGGTLYMTNTQTTVAMDPAVPSGPGTRDTVCYARGGKYASQFRLTFDVAGVTHGLCFATPNGSVSWHIDRINPKYILKQFYDLIQSTVMGDGNAATQPFLLPMGADWVPDDVVHGAWYVTTGAPAALRAAFNVTLVADTLIFAPKVTSLAYSITATETSGSDLFESVKDDVKKVGLLPLRAPQGKVVKVLGSNKKEDDYYLRWTVPNEAPGNIADKKGSWIECPAPDEPYMLDATTMPHKLEWSTANNRYEVSAATWEPRDAGNNESNPLPKFVGQTIQDHFDFQGRAGFLHSTDMTASVQDEYTNLFKKTATAELDTDPINIRSTATDGDSFPIYAVPFNKDLVLFGTNNTQFMISGRQKFIPKTASMVVTSEFDTDLKTRPRASGDNILFLSFTGKYTALHEMYLKGDQNNHARRTATDHVPRYIVGQASTFIANDGANVAGIVCDDRKTVYIYEYLWLDNKRVQSAWSKWVFACDVVHAYIVQGVMTIIQRTPDGAFILSNMTLYRKDTQNLNFQVKLDNSATHNLTAASTVDVEYCGDIKDVRLVHLDGPITGSNLRYVSAAPVAGTTVPTARVTLSQPVTGLVLSGTKYKTRFVPTMPLYRDQDGIAVTNAKLTVTDFNITYENTGPFTVIRECVYEKPEDYWTMNYTGHTLGDPDLTLGSPAMDSGIFEFPFSDDVKTSKLVIESDSHYPMTLTEIEWDGNLSNRSRRIPNGG